MQKIIQDNLQEQMEAQCPYGDPDNKEVCSVTFLRGVRDFGKWLSPLPLSWDNAFSSRQEVASPHSWSFKLRQDLWHTELAKGTEDRWACQAGDVMLCLKGYMRDTELQQQPVQCLQDRHRGLLPDIAPKDVLPLRPLSKVQIDHYLTLAAFAASSELPKAAKALQSLVEIREYERPSLTWLRSRRQFEQSSPSSRNPFFPQLDMPTWRLRMR